MLNHTCQTRKNLPALTSCFDSAACYCLWVEVRLNEAFWRHVLCPCYCASLIFGARRGETCSWAGGQNVLGNIFCFYSVMIKRCSSKMLPTTSPPPHLQGMLVVLVAAFQQSQASISIGAGDKLRTPQPCSWASRVFSAQFWRWNRGSVTGTPELCHSWGVILYLVASCGNTKQKGALQAFHCHSMRV